MRVHSVTRRRLYGRGVVAMVVALLMLPGCTMNEHQPKRVSWDLTGSPTRADVGWPADIAHWDVYHLNRHSTVTFRLPDGKSFHAEDVEVFLEAPTDRIMSIAVHTEPLTIDAAVAYATGIMAEWDMEGGSLDAWADHARRRQADDRNLARTNRQTDGPIADKGPIVSITTLNSFDRVRPAIIEVAFYWPDAPSIPTTSGSVARG